MLLDSSLPLQFWGYTLKAACYVSNHISGIHRCALCRLPRSSCAWWKTFNRFLCSKHFKPSKVDPCLYVHSSKKVFIMTHVDDCLAVSNPELMPKVIKMIKSQYSIWDLGFPVNYLGLQLTLLGPLLQQCLHPWHRSTCTPEYLELTCCTFCESLLKQFSLPCRLVTTPILSSVQLTAFNQK